MTVVSGALAGVLLLVLGLWASYAVARLWQISLYEEAEPAIAAAVARGLAVRPPGFAARIVCEGTLHDQKVRVEWRGGVLGARTIVVRGGKRARVTFVRDEDATRSCAGLTCCADIDHLSADPAFEPATSRRDDRAPTDGVHGASGRRGPARLPLAPCPESLVASSDDR